MLTYITGDILKNDIAGNKIIVHCCNDIGAFGAGISGVLARKWRVVETSYRAWHKHGDLQPFAMGECQFVLVESKMLTEATEAEPAASECMWVCNLIGQHGIGRDEQGCIPLRYDALERGLTTVAEVAKLHSASVLCPRLGTGLALGNWSLVEKVIELTLTDVQTYVYTLP